MRHVLALVPCFLLPSMPSLAASVDCARVSSAIEAMTCADTALKGPRLVMEQVPQTRGEAAADNDASGADLCGKPVRYEVLHDSFMESPVVHDKDALATAQRMGPVLIHRAFNALCAKRLLSEKEVPARIDKVVISWAGGADNFNAYFPDDRDQSHTLVTEWVWAGNEVPAFEDARAGLLCAFKPKQKLCRDLEP
jgi:hypothetical protein